MRIQAPPLPRPHWSEVLHPEGDLSTLRVNATDLGRLVRLGDHVAVVLLLKCHPTLLGRSRSRRRLSLCPRGLLLGLRLLLAQTLELLVGGDLLPLHLLPTHAESLGHGRVLRCLLESACSLCHHGRRRLTANLHVVGAVQPRSLGSGRTIPLLGGWGIGTWFSISSDLPGPGRMPEGHPARGATPLTPGGRRMPTLGARGLARGSKWGDRLRLRSSGNTVVGHGVVVRRHVKLLVADAVDRSLQDR